MLGGLQFMCKIQWAWLSVTPYVLSLEPVAELGLSEHLQLLCTRLKQDVYIPAAFTNQPTCVFIWQVTLMLNCVFAYARWHKLDGTPV